MVRSAALCVFAGLVVVGGATIASAQPPAESPPSGPTPGSEPRGDAPAPENLEATQRARQYFLQGVEHFQQHRYREAIRAFHQAAELVPSADLWFNIARAHEELSEHELAIEFYQRYLRDRVDPPDRTTIERLIVQLRERAEAEREARRTRPTTGTLRLTVNRPEADVELDEATAGRSPWPEPRALEAGRHRLQVRRAGYVPFRSEISVEAGVTTAAYADLVPETRYRAIQNDRIFTWIAWGLGVAALGTSIGLGVEAASRQGTDLDSARTWAAFSDVALGVGLGLGVTGLVLWFVEGQSVGTERITVDEGDDPAVLRGAQASTPQPAAAR